MLYSLLVALVVVALVLFLTNITVGGGIVGVLALVLLVWILMGAGRRGGSRV